MYLMEYCKAGHIITPGTEGVVVRQGGRYCPEHVPPEFIQEKPPEPEPEPTPETAPWKMTDRQRHKVEFQRWRLEHGAMADDDYPESLSEDDRERLAKHVLP